MLSFFLNINFYNFLNPESMCCSRFTQLLLTPPIDWLAPCVHLKALIQPLIITKISLFPVTAKKKKTGYEEIRYAQIQSSSIWQSFYFAWFSASLLVTLTLRWLFCLLTRIACIYIWVVINVVYFALVFLLSMYTRFLLKFVWFLMHFCTTIML